MKKLIVTLYLLAQVCALAPLSAQTTDPFLLAQEDNAKILVQNRILANVNGHPISVIDVMKKMDMLFFRQYPQYTSSPSIRYQFYLAQWKNVLDELINKELILADAEENNVPLSGGDVRQEMETMFGPNIIGNLEKVGLTFDDAWEIVKGDMMIRRMLQARVNMKALRYVTPLTVEEAYEVFKDKNPRLEEWTYNVFTIRGGSDEECSGTAQDLYSYLQEQELEPENLIESLTALKTQGEETVIKASDSIHHTEKEVSAAYMEILSKLEEGKYSAPIAQKSRSNNSTVYRIFYLKERVSGGIVPFDEVADDLQDQLFDKVITQETDTYLNKLRNHFDVKDSYLRELVPDDFEPFSIIR